MKKIFLALFFFPFFLFGNMAQHWIESSTAHSTLYGAKNCKVVREHILIKMETAADGYTAKYQIHYSIFSTVDQKVPLLFVGLDLKGKQKVFVNKISTEILDYDKEKPPYIHYSKSDSLLVSDQNLVYFEAKLNKGQNMIEISYEAKPAYSTFGFTEDYKLQYSLYPSKFWESFGPVRIELLPGDHLKIKSSNIGSPKIDGPKAIWEIDASINDTLEINFTKKVNWFSQILLFFGPLGLAFLALIVFLYFHWKALLQKLRYKNTNYKYSYWVGIILVPVLFFVVYFLAYPLIDLSLCNRGSQHGYYFFIVVFFPFLLLLYWLLIYEINRKLKMKYNNDISDFPNEN